MKKKIIPVVILLIAGLGGGLYFWFWERDVSSDLVLTGEVEGTIYAHFAEAPGKIIEMNLELGSSVKAGDLIARLDCTEQEYTLEQLQISLEKKRLTLRNLQKGVKQEELEKARRDISIAEANFRSAEATYNQARDDMEPQTQLLEAGLMTQSEWDKAKLRETTAAAALDAAKAQVEKAEEQLTLLGRGTDIETIAIAEADIRETESRIRQIQESLNKYEITANCDGTVISKNYGLGAMVNSGYNLADISSDAEKYVVCYVPKEESMRLSHGQLLTIRASDEEYQGEVRFIDVKSQYTPKDMQSAATKNKVSVKIKILLPTDTTLKPGQKVEVVLER